MKWIAIVLTSIAAAVVYGILHDLITAHICVEYFTIGHPPIFGTENPILLALGWGVIATWWVGLSLGLLLASACRFGRWPRRAPCTLLRPLGTLMLSAFGVAALAGLTGWIAAANGWVFLVGEIADRVPSDRHLPFLIDLWMHLASYLASGVGSIVLIVCVLLGRRRQHLQNNATPNQ